MRIKTFAPHLAGFMLPGIFSYLGVGLKERFPGDPYAHQEPYSAWFWMHTTDCMRDEFGGLVRLYTARNTNEALRDHLTPPKPVVGDDRPSVGSMGARQPADAGPPVRAVGGYRAPRRRAEQGELFGRAR